MQVVRKANCTIFKRSESEKRVWNAAKLLDDQQKEIESLRAELEALKGNTSETPKKRTSKKEA